MNGLCCSLGLWYVALVGICITVLVIVEIIIVFYCYWCIYIYFARGIFGNGNIDSNDI